MCRWLEQNLANMLELDNDLGWVVFDHVVDGLISDVTDAAESGVEEMNIGGEGIRQSRRTLDHALNGPFGMCTEALFRAMPDENERDSGIPDFIKQRIERLLDHPGEGSDHVVSIVFRKLNWLMFVDPNWVEKRLLPMLDFEHHTAEPAWNGFLCGNQPTCPRLTGLIKPLLLRLIPWVERQAWRREFAKVAASWLGFLYIFKQGEECGLTKRQMRCALREMSHQTRNQFICWLGDVGKQNDNGWEELVVPFLNEAWPRERKYRTASSVKSWLGMLGQTDASFPTVLTAVKEFLVSVEPDQDSLYLFARVSCEEGSITSQFPAETLDLMDAVIPKVLSRSHDEFKEVLAQIIESAPELSSDCRYLRLMDLVDNV